MQSYTFQSAYDDKDYDRFKCCFLQTFVGDESLNLVQVTNSSADSIAARGNSRDIFAPEVEVSLTTDQYMRALEVY